MAVLLRNLTEADLIALAAAVEASSEHPLAKAVVAEAKRRKVPDLKATSFEALAGRGAKALVDGKTVLVGGPRLLAEGKVEAVPDVEKFARTWASEGKTVLYTLAEGRLLGALCLGLVEGLTDFSTSSLGMSRVGYRIGPGNARSLLLPAMVSQRRPKSFYSSTVP